MQHQRARISFNRMIDLFTCYSDDCQPLADVVLPNFQEYAHKQGYRLIVRKGCYQGNEGDPYYPYNKILFLREYLLNHTVKFVWVLDLDLLLTDMRRDVAAEISLKHNLLIARDINGINAGSFLLRNSKWAIEWLDAILALRGSSSSEQHAIQKMNEIPKWSKRTRILSHPSINSIYYRAYPDHPIPKHEEGNWQPGDFVLHLPGKTMQDRIEILSSNEIQNNILR